MVPFFVAAIFIYSQIITFSFTPISNVNYLLVAHKKYNGTLFIMGNRIMHWGVYLSTSTTGESRGSSRSSRSLNKADTIIAPQCCSSRERNINIPKQA